MAARRFSYWFLFAIFIVAIVIGAIRPLRVSPMYQAIGMIQFGAMAFAAWTLGAREITSTSRGPRLLALSGIFLITPFALLALLWVGLFPGGPKIPGTDVPLFDPGFIGQISAGVSDTASTNYTLPVPGATK